MTFTEAAAQVLRTAGKPLHYKEITELAIESNLLSHVGKSPEVTMGARLAALMKKEDDDNPIVRVKPGVFALREWKNKKKGNSSNAPEGDNEVNALEVEAAAAKVAPPSSAQVIFDDDDDDSERAPGEHSGQDAFRADLAASGADLFDDEDDDDKPIMAPPSTANVAGAMGGSAEEGGEGGRRRRRRRRGRGRGREGGEGQEFQGGGNNNTAVSAGNGGAMEGDVESGRHDGAGSRPIVRERPQMGASVPNEIPVTEGDELSGRELSDAAFLALSACDRTQGPVGLRNLTDSLMRRGRLVGDQAQAATQLSASMRADNLRRAGQGVRPRFRFASGGRVAITDWSLGTDLVRMEQEALLAVERYKEAARKAFLRKVQDLPGHAFVELCLVALERMGLGSVRAIRRAGSGGGEAHFAGIHRTGADEIRTAVVIRKDGREIGRERVSDLRGALHHYGPAACGWLITTGQVLSGAREESAAPSAPPIALYDGLSFCRLLDEAGVGVTKTQVSIGIPDLELLETLRGI
ncbi:MAG: HTH domain-containing protein [Polyangiaceae bacterium]